MANLFKGYAQKSDFSGNLLKGEDPSDKILEEGKRYLSQWKDVSQGEREDQQRYLAALEAKYQAEDADRKRNQKLESYFADGWEQALHTRHQQLVKNYPRYVSLNKPRDGISTLKCRWKQAYKDSQVKSLWEI